MKQKDILVILIPSFLITLLWVIFSIYHNFVTTTIKDPLTYQIIPIDGTFNMEGINKIKNRKNFEPVYTLQGETNITPSPNISGTPSETPTPTEEIIQGTQE